MKEENEEKIIQALEAILAVQKEILVVISQLQIEIVQVRRSLS